ncbi:MAG: hypothetical protein ACHQIG_09325 [Acidimicrobiia bacterium]
MGGGAGEHRQPRGSSSCTGVYRRFGDTGGSCSLGRHCLVLALVGDHDAYRKAHTRFSDASQPLEPGPSVGGTHSEQPRSNQALLEVITDAMGRLDELNPPRE